MTKVYKDGIEREVKDSKLEGYLAAGWTTQSVANNLVKDTTSSKPTVKASAAVKSVEVEEEAIIKETEDGNNSW